MMSDSPAHTPFSLSTIGVIRSPYQEKFAVPRQLGLVTAINAQLDYYRHIMIRIVCEGSKSSVICG